MADYVDTKVSNLVINNLTQEKYDELLASGQINPDELYCTPARELTSVATDDTMTGDGTPENPLSVADALASKADDNAVMHLSGDEVVDGEKTLLKTLYVAYNDADAFRGYVRAQDGYLMIGTADAGSSVWNDSLRILKDKVTFAGQEVATKASASLTGNGYIKYKNGLIAQWGAGSYASGDTVTLPTAFSSGTSYRAIIMRGGNAPGPIASANQATANFTIYHNANATVYWHWIAIGF